MSLVLADTSIWVEHFRRANPLLVSLIESDRMLCHPLVILELACGSPPAPRERTLSDIGKLRQAVVATSEEILMLIEKNRLQESGCGAVDVSLLASVMLTPNALLWTADRKLATLAIRSGVGYAPARH